MKQLPKLLSRLVEEASQNVAMTLPLRCAMVEALIADERDADASDLLAEYWSDKTSMKANPAIIESFVKSYNVQCRFADIAELLQRASEEGVRLSRFCFVETLDLCATPQSGDTDARLRAHERQYGCALSLIRLMHQQGLIITGKDVLAATKACAATGTMDELVEVAQIAAIACKHEEEVFYRMLVAVYSEDSDKAVEMATRLTDAGIDVDIDTLLAYFTEADKQMDFVQLVNRYKEVDARATMGGKMNRSVKMKNLLGCITRIGEDVPKPLQDDLLKLDRGDRMRLTPFVERVSAYLTTKGKDKLLDAHFANNIVTMALHFDGADDKPSIDIRGEDAKLFENRLLPWTEENKKKFLNYLSPHLKVAHKAFFDATAALDLKSLVYPQGHQNTPIAAERANEYRFQAAVMTNSFEAALEALKLTKPRRGSKAPPGDFWDGKRSKLWTKLSVDDHFFWIPLMLRRMIQNHDPRKKNSMYTHLLIEAIDLINIQIPGVLQQSDYINMASLLVEKRDPTHRAMADAVVEKYVMDEDGKFNVEEKSKMALARYYAAKGQMHKVETLLDGVDFSDRPIRERFRIDEQLLEGYIAARRSGGGRGHWWAILQAENVYVRIQESYPEQYAEKKEFVDANMIAGTALFEPGKFVYLTLIFCFVGWFRCPDGFFHTNT